MSPAVQIEGVLLIALLLLILSGVVPGVLMQRRVRRIIGPHRLHTDDTD